MAAYKTGAFVRSKYYTPFQKMPLKWIQIQFFEQGPAYKKKGSDPNKESNQQ